MVLDVEILGAVVLVDEVIAQLSEDGVQLARTLLGVVHQLDLGEVHSIVARLEDVAKLQKQGTEFSKLFEALLRNRLKVVPAQ